MRSLLSTAFNKVIVNDQLDRACKEAEDDYK